MPPLSRTKQSSQQMVPQNKGDLSLAQAIHGDCVEVMNALEPGSIDAIVCDPPYGLEFMGKGWDKLGATTGSIADRWIGKDGKSIPANRVNYGKSSSEWQAMQEWHAKWLTAALRVIKPGGYIIAFSGTRTSHRLTCAAEDVGWEIRDVIMWLYGSGFPKSKSCLKPAYEPALLARAPSDNVLDLSIDECRIGTESRFNEPAGNTGKSPASLAPVNVTGYQGRPAVGRWPANVVLSDDPEVLEMFAALGESKSRSATMPLPLSPGFSSLRPANDGSQSGNNGESHRGHDDSGNPSRFFYVAKASRTEREAGIKEGIRKATGEHCLAYHNGVRRADPEVHNFHPTVKPIALMEWLCRLVSHPGDVVLDPFLGSGSTGIACINTGRRFIGIEKEKEYYDIARKRIGPPHAAILDRINKRLSMRTEDGQDLFS